MRGVRTRKRIVELLRNPRQFPALVQRYCQHYGRRTVRKLRTAEQRLYALLHRKDHLRVVDLESIAPNDHEASEPILDDVCLPPHRDKEHDDLGALLRIVRAVEPRVVLEFGTAHGNITANICRMTNAHVYTINALPEQLGGRVVTFDGLTRQEIGSVYRRHGFADRVTQIYSDTRDFEPHEHFTEPTVDLAIIDACHDTSFVLNDFLKAQPVLRRGATVLLHDTHPSMEEHLGGSYIACMKLKRKGFDIQHIKGTWWGIWTKP